MFGMLWSGPVTLFLLIQVSTVFSLSCFYCYSEISWEDCKSKEKKPTCAAQNTCLRFHRKVTRPNGKEVQQFVKTCIHTSSCTRNSCYDTEGGEVTWCEWRCCSTNLCNQEIKPTSTARKDSTNSTKDSTRPPAITSSGSKFHPINNVQDYLDRKRRQRNSTKKTVQIITPRAVHSRKNSKKNLGSLIYVTVAMVTIPLVVAKH